MSMQAVVHTMSEKTSIVFAPGYQEGGFKRGAADKLRSEHRFLCIKTHTVTGVLCFCEELLGE
jgi:hypothetical protein